jgi:hypothetical protein
LLGRRERDTVSGSGKEAREKRDITDVVLRRSGDAPGRARNDEGREHVRREP